MDINNLRPGTLVRVDEPKKPSLWQRIVAWWKGVEAHPHLLAGMEGVPFLYPHDDLHDAREIKCGPRDLDRTLRDIMKDAGGTPVRGGTGTLVGPATALRGDIVTVLRQYGFALTVHDGKPSLYLLTLRGPAACGKSYAIDRLTEFLKPHHRVGDPSYGSDNQSHTVRITPIENLASVAATLRSKPATKAKPKAADKRKAAPKRKTAKRKAAR